MIHIHATKVKVAKGYLYLSNGVGAQRDRAKLIQLSFHISGKVEDLKVTSA